MAHIQVYKLMWEPSNFQYDSLTTLHDINIWNSFGMALVTRSPNCFRTKVCSAKPWSIEWHSRGASFKAEIPFPDTSGLGLLTRWRGCPPNDRGLPSDAATWGGWWRRCLVSPNERFLGISIS